MAVIERLWTRDNLFYYLMKYDRSCESYFRQGRKYTNLNSLKNFAKYYISKNNVVKFYADTVITEECKSKLELLLYDELVKGVFQVR